MPILLKMTIEAMGLEIQNNAKKISNIFWKTSRFMIASLTNKFVLGFNCEVSSLYKIAIAY